MWLKRDESKSIQEVVMRNLGIASIDEIREWAEKTKNASYYIYGLNEALTVIEKFKDKRIRICGDYDVDGRCAAIILFLALRRFGCKNVDVRIPRRFSEGYGMNAEMINEVKEDDALIITVDNGITAFEAVEVAKRRGMTVVVTDHHLPMEDTNGNPVLPDADIIIDPHAIPGSAAFDGYCGAGIAYRLAQHILKEDGFVHALLPFAAVATVADVMDLREENYILVKDGLEMITSGKAAPGLMALATEMDIRTCTSTDVGFKIAPALNAPGRMEDKDAYTLPLLACKDPAKAIEIADQIIAINEERKKAVSEGMEIAEDDLRDSGYKEGLIVARVKNAGAGIVGIIAGRLSDAYGVPAIVLNGPDERGLLHGSARSVGDYNISETLSALKDLLVSFGGHAQAAGLALKAECFDEFKEKAREIYSNSGFSLVVSDEAYYDLEINSSQVLTVLQELDRFEPYGHGNEKPVFKIKNFRLTDKPRKIAGDGVRMKSASLSAIGFGLWPRMEEFGDGLATYTLYGTLSWNEYKGFRRAQIEIADIEKESKMVTTPFAAALKKM